MADRGAPSRRPPAEVPPVTVDGVRYEQIRFGPAVDPDDPNGWLQAISEADGSVLWTKQVITTQLNRAREGGSTIYFKTMSVAADGSIHIENEIGTKVRVDPKTGESTPID